MSKHSFNMPLYLCLLIYHWALYFNFSWDTFWLFLVLEFRFDKKEAIVAEYNANKLWKFKKFKISLSAVLQQEVISHSGNEESKPKGKK